MTVLDASAVLAMVEREPGGQEVRALISDASTCISSVNFAELLAKVASRGADPRRVAVNLEASGLEVVQFGSADALESAELWAHTHAAGLSLGDRACLALARRLGVEARTTDRAWAKVNVPGVTVGLLR